MATNKIQLNFDFNAKDVQIASDRVLSLTQQIRILKKEIQKEGLSAEQFEILSKKLGEFEDTAARTSARSKDLVTSLQLIPGPIGQIASQINGTIALLKTFSGFKLNDLKFQFRETLDDIRDIGQWIGKTTGLTKLWTVSTNAMAGAMRALGVAQQTAAVASKALAAAIAATGIGLLIVALGTLIPKIMDWVSGTDKATAANDRLSESIARTKRELDAQQEAISDQAELDILRAKLAGKSEADIQAMREKALKDQIAADKLSLSEKGKFFRDAMRIEMDATIKEEDRDKRRKENDDNRIAAAQRLRNNEIALEKLQLQGQIDAKGRQEAQQQKNSENNKKILQDQLNFRKEIADKVKQSLDLQIQNEIDATNTSEEKLKALYAKRNQIELDELTRAENLAKQQLQQKKITSEEYTQIIAGIEARRVKIARDTTKSITDSLQADKKVEDDRIKSIEDYNKRIRDLRIAAIDNDAERRKAELAAQEQDEMDALMRDENFIKESEEKKGEIKLAIRKKYAKLVKGVDDDVAKQEEADENKRRMERLRILELEGQSLIKGTRSYFKNRLEILNETQKLELEAADKAYKAGEISEAEYQAKKTAIEKKGVMARKDLKQQEVQAMGQMVSASIDALAGLTNAIAGSLDEEAKTSKEAFEKRKKLQIATAVMSAASGLVQILTQPSTIPSPGDWIVKGVNAAALAIATATNIKKIKQTQFEGSGEGAGTGVVAMRAQGGIVTGPGTSTSDSIPAMISNGEYVVNARATSAFLPMLNAINDYGRRPRFAMGGLVQTQSPQTIFTDGITRALEENMMTRPMKTYVVGQEVSNQQQLDRIIKSRSLM